MLIIDRRHIPWMWTTLVVAMVLIGFFFYYDETSPTGFTGRSIAGICYGILALMSMIYLECLWLMRIARKGWLGFRRSWWLRGHIWIGLLGVVLVVLHSGGLNAQTGLNWGGGVEFWLWVSLIWTVATGIFGILLQNILPRLITNQIPVEAPLNQISEICSNLRKKADRAVEEQCGADLLDRDWGPSQQSVMDVNERFVQLYVCRLRPFFDADFDRSNLFADAVQARAVFDEFRTADASGKLSTLLDLVEGSCQWRRQLGEQVRLHWMLHSWLFLHVPATIVVLLLVAVHAVMTMYF